MKKFETESLNSLKDSEEFWNSSAKFEKIKAKTLLNHYKQDKIDTRSLIQKYQIYLKKHTSADQNRITTLMITLKSI